MACGSRLPRTAKRGGHPPAEFRRQAPESNRVIEKCQRSRQTDHRTIVTVGSRQLHDDVEPLTHKFSDVRDAIAEALPGPDVDETTAHEPERPLERALSICHKEMRPNFQAKVFQHRLRAQPVPDHRREICAKHVMGESQPEKELALAPSLGCTFENLCPLHISSGGLEESDDVGDPDQGTPTVLAGVCAEDQQVIL